MYTAVCTIAILALGSLGPGEDQPLELPRTIQIGEAPAVLRPLLAEDCQGTEELHYTGEMAAPFREQLQINCAGLDVFGAGRKVEFMFDDGPLGHVWIHVETSELNELAAQLEASFGAVVHRNRTYIVFNGGVALRHQPPEVLVATPALISRLTGYRGN